MAVESTKPEKIARKHHPIRDTYDKDDFSIAKESPGGRPGHLETLGMDVLAEIAIKYAKAGSFWFELPAAIHKETGKVITHKALEEIIDRRFQETKALCFAYCTAYWREQMHMASIPSNVWTFIMKNVAKWSDNRTVTIDPTSAIEMKSTDSEKAKEKLEQLKIMLSDKV